MRKALLWVAAITAIVVIGEQWLFPPGSSPQGSLPLVGKTAPDFRLPDLNGAETSLSEHRGKVVVLDFWATWCGPCRKSMPILDRIQAGAAEDMVLLAVNLRDSVDVVREYIARQGFRSRVLLDTEGKIGRVYGVVSIPLQVIVDPDGVVRDVHLGFNGRLESSIRDQIRQLRRTAD
jgi:thiol-disulfide isomerase/thioredoxin